MLHSVQLFGHVALTSIVIAVTAAVFRDASWWQLVTSCGFLLVFHCYLASALWVPAFSKGPPWEDRVGIIIHGLSFVLIALAILRIGTTMGLVCSIVGLAWLFFARRVFELTLAARRGHH